MMTPRSFQDRYAADRELGYVEATSTLAVQLLPETDGNIKTEEDCHECSEGTDAEAPSR